MRATMFFATIIAIFLFACNGTDTATHTSSTNHQAKSNPEMLAAAAAMAKVPTSIGLNFASGYWHIASGFNVDSLGDFREYDGTWLQMKPNHELVWGKLDADLGSGAWAWDEGKGYLTFISDTSKEFFIGEWSTNSKGDIYVCVGSTPNNPRSTQFKLVRRQQKIVTE